MNLKKILKNIVILIIPIIGMSSDTAYVFDLDDTLLKTNARIYLKNERGDQIEGFTSSQLRDNKRRLIEMTRNSTNYLCFNEIGENPQLTYEYLKSSREITENMDLFRSVYNRNRDDVYILTGRGNAPEIIQLVFLERWNIDLKLENIIPVAHKNTINDIENKFKKRFKNEEIFNRFEIDHSPIGSANKKKKLCLFYILTKKNYTKLIFYDDDMDNIREAEELKRDLKNYQQYLEYKLDIIHIKDE